MLLDSLVISPRAATAGDPESPEGRIEGRSILIFSTRSGNYHAINFPCNFMLARLFFIDA
jgi:hypothetical protein